MKDKITDPRHLPVQLNIRVPWDFREELYRISKKRGVSLNSLVVDVLQREYLDTKQQTRDAGSTS